MCTDFTDSVKYSGWLNINFSDLEVRGEKNKTKNDGTPKTCDDCILIAAFVTAVQASDSQKSRCVRRSSIEPMG